MRPYQTTFPGYATADPDSIALTQTPLAGGDLTLNGTLVSGGVATLSPAGFITITTNGDESAKNATVYGTTAEGWTVVLGPFALAASATTTTYSVISFATVTRIAVSAALGAAVTVGTAQSGAGPWMPLDIMVPNQVTTISTNISGSLNYSWQFTNDNIWGEAPTFAIDPNTIIAYAHPVAGLTGASSDQVGSTTTLMRAVRFLVNSGSGTARNVVMQQSTQ